MNNVSLIGRLTKDTELKATANGKEVLQLCIAVNRSFDREKADFIDCVAWGQTAKFINQYFVKGSAIAITGEIQTRSYEDKNGSKRKITEIIVNKAEFCEKAKKENAGLAFVYDNELPF